MVNIHTSCYYAILCYTLQGAVPALIFLAKHYQPNGHNNQMALVDPLEGYELDTLTTRVHPWDGPDNGPAHNNDYNYGHKPDIHGFSCHDPALGRWHFMHLGYSTTI